MPGLLEPRVTDTRLKRHLAISALLLTKALATGLLLMPGSALAREAGLRYRVEVLVFRHTGTEPTPATVEHLRPFLQAAELQPPGPDQPPHPHTATLVDMPYRLPEDGDFLKQTWSRLDRLAGYEPLLRMTWEQNQVDYHPPVRVHDAEVIVEELHFPTSLVWLDLDSDDPFAPYLAPLYRLDGTVQLRRSRFLHLDLDLEYRIDDPAWLQAAPLPPAPGLVQPEAAPPDAQAPTPEAGPPEPFRVHRLRSSRQIRSNEVHYFDTAYLGVLARVTSIADP